MNGVMTLGPGAVDVWIGRVSEWAGHEAFDRLMEVLSPEELERRDAFVFAKDRESYGLAHGMLRFALSRYAARPPESWRFEVNAHGRPEMAVDQTEGVRWFNLSHTEGLAACAFSADREVGIDVEFLGRPGVDIDTVSRSFSSAEQAALAGLESTERRRVFFAIWTLKEAYVKGTGRGLGVGLDQFTVRLEAAGARLEGVEEPWRLLQLNVGNEAMLSLAVRGERSPDVGVHWFSRSLAFPE